jgi:hypothetical protein
MTIDWRKNMDDFFDIMWKTVAACCGICLALCVVYIAVSVAGVLLGSGVGTLLLGYLMWKGYKYWVKNHK